MSRKNNIFGVVYVWFITGVISTVVLVHCDSERKAKLIAGAGDGRLKQIMAAVQRDLQSCFLTRVRVSIILKYREKEKNN